MTTFQDLLSRHIASSLLKQQYLSAVLGSHNWNVDLTTGRVDFGRKRLYPIQIIGTESEVSGSWLWGWANEGSEIPAELLSCSRKVQALGEKEGVVELLQPQISLNEMDAHMLAMVACGICEADAYYRGPYDGGALFFAIQGMPPLKQATSPVEAINIMSSVISQFPVDHRTMVMSFLSQQGFAVAEVEGAVVATGEGGQIQVGFDASGRVSGMETTAVARAGARKPWWRLGK